jgi:hypothetical protein
VPVCDFNGESNVWELEIMPSWEILFFWLIDNPDFVTSSTPSSDLLRKKIQ